MKERDFAGLVRMLKPAVLAYARERYYGRMPVMKIMVSPVDKDAIDEISGNPETSAVVLNGVRDGVPRGQFPKIPGRIIFTGNMDFPPNYEAALWFLNHVFPLVVSQRPDVCLVIAGANPILALRERASKNVVVTGYVEDLNREIACSEVFVAPLISGGGFKNKVMEAMVNRSSVVATSMAAECFPPGVRALLSIADSPADMAEAIMAVWRDPQTAEGRAQTLHEIVTGQFSWASQAAKIVELARNAMAQTNARSLV
jgi:glycosyltransferase involved in cell wall biosynthesis